jgi:hypothetical protein
MKAVDYTNNIKEEGVIITLGMQLLFFMRNKKILGTISMLFA